ncbi:hypothetical protein PHYPSEUDO_002792 [Phytophthora pseudosyringae]|uniref:RxLR effector protein n=1 Tax=Phytophthora pseudosyringae TaxID=221518 RepID=A0A8T1VSV8_9STRA|nr:hypothetical protein PHYPSEUDO_002792 [Phytophthora pseudosyringae]
MSHFTSVVFPQFKLDRRMRPQGVLLLAIATFVLACGWPTTNADSSLTAHGNDFTTTGSTTRLLRTEARAVGFDKVAKLVASTKAQYNENKQLRGWLKEEQSADDVFMLLKLEDGTKNVLTSPKIKAWASYISLFNNKYQNDRVHMIDILSARYGEDGASKMIEAAKSVPGSKALAEKLQTDQFRGWLQGKKSPIKVLRILKLDDPANLDSVNVDALIKYLGVFNHRTKKTTSMLDLFTRAYGGEQKLVQKLVTAPASNKLETALFTQWLLHGWDRETVMTGVFKLHQHDWFSSPAAPLLIRYSTFYLDKVKAARGH